MFLNVIASSLHIFGFSCVVSVCTAHPIILNSKVVNDLDAKEHHPFNKIQMKMIFSISFDYE